MPFHSLALTSSYFKALFTSCL